MTVSTITYYAPTENLGDVTEEQAELYREWALEQLTAKCPAAEIEVLNENAVSTVFVDADTDEETEAATEFAKGLWDNCPWDFI